MHAHHYCLGVHEFAKVKDQVLPSSGVLELRGFRAFIGREAQFFETYSQYAIIDGMVYIQMMKLTASENPDMTLYTSTPIWDDKCSRISELNEDVCDPRFQQVASYREFNVSLFLHGGKVDHSCLWEARPVLTVSFLRDAQDGEKTHHVVIKIEDSSSDQKSTTPILLDGLGEVLSFARPYESQLVKALA